MIRPYRCYITLKCGRHPARLVDGGDRLLQLLPIPGDTGHLGAGASQRVGDRLAQTARSAGHQRNLAF
jgi:hypothetical protein